MYSIWSTCQARTDGKMAKTQAEAIEDHQVRMHLQLTATGQQAGLA